MVRRVNVAFPGLFNVYLYEIAAGDEGGQSLPSLRSAYVYRNDKDALGTGVLLESKDGL